MYSESCSAEILDVTSLFGQREKNKRAKLSPSMQDARRRNVSHYSVNSAGSVSPRGTEQGVLFLTHTTAVATHS